MPWICPRCQLVHSDYSMECNCPVPTGTSTNSAEHQMTPEVVSIPSCWTVPQEKLPEGELTTTAWPNNHTEMRIQTFASKLEELDKKLRSIFHELKDICKSLSTFRAIITTKTKKDKK
jgi:hypothetical protein